MPRTPCLLYVSLGLGRVRSACSDVMFQVSVLWKDSPENPKNAGGEKKETKAKKSASKPSKKAEKESPGSDTD